MMVKLWNPKKRNFYHELNNSSGTKKFKSNPAHEDLLEIQNLVKQLPKIKIPESDIKILKINRMDVTLFDIDMDDLEEDNLQSSIVEASETLNIASSSGENSVQKHKNNLLDVIPNKKIKVLQINPDDLPEIKIEQSSPEKNLNDLLDYNNLEPEVLIQEDNIDSTSDGKQPQTLMEKIKERMSKVKHWTDEIKIENKGSEMESIVIKGNDGEIIKTGNMVILRRTANPNANINSDNQKPKICVPEFTEQNYRHKVAMCRAFHAFLNQYNAIQKEEGTSTSNNNIIDNVEIKNENGNNNKQLPQIKIENGNNIRQLPEIMILMPEFNERMGSISDVMKTVNAQKRQYEINNDEQIKDENINNVEEISKHENNDSELSEDELNDDNDETKRRIGTNILKYKNKIKDEYKLIFNSKYDDENTTDSENDDPSEVNRQLMIGPNGTKVSGNVLYSIDWNKPTHATRKLLMEIFDRNTLATHNLTGKKSPIHHDDDSRQAKNQLDPLKISDIIYRVQLQSNISERAIRNSITTKCADESKMQRYRDKKLKSIQAKENPEVRESQVLQIISKENIDITTHGRLQGK